MVEPQRQPAEVARDRKSCLRIFEEYYRDHCGALSERARSEGAGSGSHGPEGIFEEVALLRLYEDYCRASAARLHDSVQRIMPFMNAGPGDSKALRILDISCFATTQLFRIMFPKATVHACDKHLRWGSFLDGVECRSCNLETDALPYDDEYFDLVVFTETLEHVPRSPYAILADVKRVLRKGGVLLLSVPNLVSLTNRVKMLMGMDILSVERFYVDSFGHFREYSMQEIKYLFEQVGIERLVCDFTFYAGALHTSGSGIRAMRSRFVNLVSRPIMLLFPALRPVCLVIGRK